MSEEIDTYKTLGVQEIVEACNIFNTAMINKMIDKLSEGYEGWDSAGNYNFIESSLKDHVKKGVEPDNLVDIANFCMMLYILEVGYK